MVSKKITYSCRITGVLRVLLLISAVAASAGYAGNAKSVAYYPGWVAQTNLFSPEAIDASQLTHIIYAFVTPNSDGTLAFSDMEKQATAEANFKQLAELKKKYSHIKTLVSIGGGTQDATQKCAKMVSTAQAREQFAHSCKAFCEKYNFDGIDIDWEYPQNNTEKDNLTALIAGVARVCRRRHKDFLITLAGPVNFKRLAFIDLASLDPHLSWVNIMAYDFHGPWKGSPLDTVTNHLAPLYPGTGNTPDFCIEAAINYYLKEGVQPEKLVLGIPLYGRSFGGVSQTPTGLLSPFSGPGSGHIRPGIHTIAHVKNGISKTHTLYWDDIAQAAYYFNPALSDFVSCETEQSLAVKARYIRDRKLGGAMFWALYNPDVLEYVNYMSQQLAGK